MAVIRYSKTYKENVNGHREFQLSPGDFLDRSDVERALSMFGGAVIIGRQWRGGDSEPREVPEAHEVLEWANALGLIDTEKYATLILDDTTGSFKHEVTIFSEFDWKSDILYAPCLHETVIPEDFLVWNNEDSEFIPREMDDEQLEDYLRNLLRIASVHLGYDSFHITDLGEEMPPKNLETLSALVSQISNGHIEVSSDEMSCSYGVGLQRGSLLRRGLAAGEELGAIAQKIVDIQALTSLLHHVVTGELREMRQLNPSSCFSTPETIGKFLSESTCFSILLDSYLNGVPIEDILA